MTKVLVLGATGFIGSAVAKALARAGHEVIGQTRDVSKNGKTLQQQESECGVRLSFMDGVLTVLSISLQSPHFRATPLPMTSGSM